MKKPKKIVSALVVTTMMGTAVMACSSPAPQSSSDNKNTPAPQGGPTTYPIKTDKTLTYWMELPTNLTGVKSTHADTPFFQEWQKKTGVPLKFTAPPANQAKEALNVMLASGELPDMIEFNFLDFPGGPEKAIKDGYILKLNDLIDKHAPNLKKYLKEHPEIDKMIKTDNGSYYAFPFLRGDESLMVYQGPIVRKDWLDELGIPMPQTIDEWTAMLKAFKEKKGAAAPFTVNSKPRVFNDFNNGPFMGAYGVTRGFYLENGQIKFGPQEKGYKEFLGLFRSWYADGLLDKNIATVDIKAWDANIASGATGATVGNAGGGIGKWQPLVEAKDPKGLLAAAPYPVLKKGDTPKFGQRDQPFSPGGMVAVTATSKNAELAVKLLDYGYSPEGHMFFNFGTEGVSYKLENGEPKYTDLLLKNPDKLAPAQAMSMHIRANYNGPFVQDKRYIMQYLALPNQREAIGVWKTDVAKHQMPPVTPTPEESSEYAKIMTDVNTLVDEMTLKIILGTEPLDQFEKYVEKLKSLKIDRAIEIQKAALERYNKR
ncbi:extracellular solute-binding protein [Paenibacillus sp. GD4]|jgi:putative aldouronate transport system substrate-binding protein|uniref:extracellular solute-binding protein n=1 Tax=Paenibacillus sp. GD4 TaxID=3068890 RepID=UPI00279641E2|nr:extracellular solute-binding protein [Paenibacillus sp. GD4]MDQ1912796.1 extracellular solute-binding protein [Paenibacillus sp. GD4]